MRRARRVTLTLATLLAMSLPVTAPAGAKPLSPCGSVHALGQLYGLGKKNVKCGFVRRWARHYLKHGQQPPGWKCFGREFEVGNCHTPGQGSLFQFYVQD